MLTDVSTVLFSRYGAQENIYFLVQFGYVMLIKQKNNIQVAFLTFPVSYFHPCTFLLQLLFRPDSNEPHDICVVVSLCAKIAPDIVQSRCLLIAYWSNLPNPRGSLDAEETQRRMCKKDFEEIYFMELFSSCDYLTEKGNLKPGPTTCDGWTGSRESWRWFRLVSALIFCDIQSAYFPCTSQDLSCKYTYNILSSISKTGDLRQSVTLQQKGSRSKQSKSRGSVRLSGWRMMSHIDRSRKSNNVRKRRKYNRVQK